MVKCFHFENTQEKEVGNLMKIKVSCLSLDFYVDEMRNEPKNKCKETFKPK
jgi:hypothetical protein